MEPWRTINPYRGLSALEEEDADFFFGREKKTAEILNAVATASDNIITLIGNSGVGKTSNPRNTINRFSAILADGLSDRRVVVMTSLRSDFYGYLQANEAVFPVTERIDVPPLAANELKTVLREPPRLLNVTFESEGLVDVLVNGAKEQPGALPLLADFMTELWRRMQSRGDGVLRIVEKREVLQLGEALARRADLFVEEHMKEMDTVRRLFTRLVTLHEGSEPARRRVFLDTCTPSERGIAQELASDRWRLVVTGQEEGQGRYAEVAHEVLLREWETLKFWLDDQKSFLLWKTDVEKFYRRWIAAPRLQRKDALLFGLTLTDARRWAQAKPSEVDAHLRSFIVRSAEARAFSFWNSFIIFLGLLLFLPFLVVVSHVSTGLVPLLLGATALSLATGWTVRFVAGAVFRMTVRTLELGSRPTKASARAALKDMIETMRAQSKFARRGFHESLPPPLPLARRWGGRGTALESGERADGTIVEAAPVAPAPEIRFWPKLKLGLAGTVLGLFLFAIETALIAMGSANLRDFVIGQGALALMSLQFAMASRRSDASEVRAIFSATTFLTGLLGVGVLVLGLDVLSGGALGLAALGALFLGLLVLVLCAYVLFVWRYVGRPAAN